MAAEHANSDGSQQYQSCSHFFDTESKLIPDCFKVQLLGAGGRQSGSLQLFMGTQGGQGV